MNAALITMVERFQNKADRPYKEISGASAIHSNHTFNESVVGEADASFHPNRENIFIIVIRGREMIKLVHDLYRRAANEA